MTHFYGEPVIEVGFFELREMYQAFNLLFETDEYSDWCNLGDAATNNVIKIGESELPQRIWLERLQRETNLFLFPIDMQDHGDDHLPDSDNVGRMVEVTPRQVGGTYVPLPAIEIDEYPEVMNRSYSAFAYLPALKKIKRF